MAADKDIFLSRNDLQTPFDDLVSCWATDPTIKKANITSFLDYSLGMWRGGLFDGILRKTLDNYLTFYGIGMPTVDPTVFLYRFFSVINLALGYVPTKQYILKKVTPTNIIITVSDKL